MLRVVAGLVVLLAVLKGTEQQKGIQQKEGGQGFRVEELLDIDYESQRKDLFARCLAISERYETSSHRSFAEAISELESYCDLDKQQRRKLDLAIRGSAKHTRRKFREELEATAEIKSDQKAYDRLSQLAARMRESLTDPTRSSFWQTTLRRTLTDRQQQQLRLNRDAREVFLKEAWVIDVVRETDRHLRLRFEHRDQLLERLREWVRNNEIPEIQRSRRGPWKYVRNKATALVFLRGLTPNHRKQLIQLAPKKLRDEISAGGEPEVDQRP